MKTMMNCTAQQLSNESMQRINGGVVGGDKNTNNTFKYFITIYDMYGRHVGTNYVRDDAELAIVKKEVQLFSGRLVVSHYNG